MLLPKMSRGTSDCGQISSMMRASLSDSYLIGNDAKLSDACDSYRVSHAAWRRLIEANPEIEDYDDAPDDLRRHGDLWRDSLTVIMVSAPSTPRCALLKLEVLMEHSRWAGACADTADFIATAMVELQDLMTQESSSVMDDFRPVEEPDRRRPLWSNIMPNWFSWRSET